jgi:hypothetical protein
MTRSIVAALAVALPTTAALADPQNISRFAPVQVEDAYATSPGTLQFQGTGIHTRDPHDRRGEDTWEARPLLRVGVAPGLRFALTAPYRWGDSSRSGSGDLDLDLKYNPNEQTAWAPALAVMVGHSHPHGGGTRPGEAETFARLFATKWLGEGRTAPRLHLNATWYRAMDPAPTARRDRYDVGIAYTQLVGPRTALVVDLVRAQRERRGETQNILDVGFNHEVAEGLSLGGAVGVGLGTESPDFRAIVALRKSFRVF